MGPPTPPGASEGAGKALREELRTKTPRDPQGLVSSPRPTPAQGFNKVVPARPEDSPSAPERQEAWGPVLALAFLPWGPMQGPGPPLGPPQVPTQGINQATLLMFPDVKSRAPTQRPDSAGPVGRPGAGRVGGCSWKSPGSRVKTALGMTPTPVTSWAILGEPVPTGSSPARRDLATRGQWDHWDSLRGTRGEAALRTV